MKNNIFVHVGLQKTGTTALQNVFANMKDVQYFHYMDWYTVVKPDVDILFSNEDLSGYPIGNRLDRYSILDNIKQAFPTAKIIVGFRNPHSWQSSLYKESVRQGYTKGFSSYLKEFDNDYIDYEKYEIALRDSFDEVFGYHFEDLKHNFSGVVKEICEFIGKPCPCFNNEKVNISLDDNQVRGLRFINRFCESWHNPNGLVPGIVLRKLIGRIRT